MRSEQPATTETRAADNQDGVWLEPDLYYQGEAPPKGDWSPNDWVMLPHEHYIAASKARLFQVLLSRPSTQAHGESFRHFLELLDAIYHFHYHRTLNELKEDYEYFAPETGEQLREGIATEELLWRERRFLTNFLQAMTKGNYVPYTDGDHAQAMEHDYLFDLPVDVRWDIYDQRLLKGYLDEADSPEGEEAREALGAEGSMRDFLQLPKAFDERILLFYRGLDRDQSSGLFLMPKVDVLVARIFGLFVFPVQWLIDRIRGSESHVSVPSIGDAVSAFTFGFVQLDREQKIEGEAEARTSIFTPRWVRRINLQNQALSPADLLKVTRLQEPALERVIAIFRLVPPKPPAALDRIPALKRLFERFGGQTEVEDVDWTLNIKLFKHIPLADSEIIFPEKIIRMKSFDLTMLFVTGFIGLFILVRNLSDPNASKSAIVIVLSVLVAYAIKIFTGFRRTRSNYMAQMTHELYHKSLDNDAGVLQYLIDSLEEQEVKEALLAYFCLWEAGRPMSEEELDGTIEGFIKENFNGLEVDLEIEDALDKVVEREGEHPYKHMPIVTTSTAPDGTILYQAKPLEEALRVMDQKWDDYFNYNE